MFKRLLFFVIFFALYSLPIQAQGGWSIWLFSDATGTITQVRNDGSIAGSFALPLPQAFNRYGAFAEVSLSGRYVAYTAYDSTTERPNVQLFVLDRDLSATRFNFDVTDAVVIDDATNNIPVVFDEANQQVAFGFVTEQNGWQVVVGDFATSAPLASLTANDHPLFEATADLLPVVQRYDGTHVWFTGYTDGAGTSPAFRWNIGSGEVVEDAVFTSLLADFDPFSGQVAVVDGNAVEIISAQGERATLYTESEGTIQRALFVEFGARVLIEVRNGETTTLKVLNRDGTTAGEIIGSLDNLTGTPDGFIGFFTTDQGAPAVAHVATTAETYAPDTLWTGTQNETVSLPGIILDADFVTPEPPSFQD